MSRFINPPVFTKEEIGRLLHHHYGISGDIHFLPSERDENCLLTLSDGKRYVLKIANQEENLNDISFQNQVLSTLSAKMDVTPSLVKTLGGEQMCLVPAKNGRGSHAVRLLTYIEGQTMADISRHSPELLASLGQTMALLDLALMEMGESEINRGFPWDPAVALEIIERHRKYLAQRDLKRRMWAFVQRVRSEIEPIMKQLPRSLIYNDANDYNLLVKGQEVCGIIDFGDIVWGATVADLAVACAYAVLNQSDPLAVMAAMVAAYHLIRPLSDNELAVLFSLMRLRLCVSLCMSAWQQHQRPDEDYLFVSQKPILQTLPKLLEMNDKLVLARLRLACGLDPLPASREVLNWLKKGHDRFHPVVPVDFSTDPLMVLDLGISSPLYRGDPQESCATKLNERIAAALESVKQNGAAIGSYDEPRLLYTSALFQGEKAGVENRTVHLGVDVFMPAGTPVSAPLDGTVAAFARNRAALDYGPVIILEHRTEAGDPFYTLYGHLSTESLKGLVRGQTVKAGQVFARLGSSRVNGGYAPHLHFQLILDHFQMATNFPGVVRPSEREFWCAVSPDPNLILGISVERLMPKQPSAAETLARRRKRIGPSLSIGYREPVKLVRGWMQYLYDEGGRRYLDAYNNVPHVGHCHPRVVDALCRQAGILNTNTRYLHDHINELAEKLTATLPSKLEVCFFLNSASEANELALRMARTLTGRRDMIVLEAAYHGHTSSLIDISPYKHDGPGGQGAPDWVHKAALADVYRGAYRADDPQCGAKYAAAVGDLIDKMQVLGKKPAGFIAESCPSVGGQIFFPEGYLADVYRRVRSAGGLCIADEVQTGYGRIGTGMYAFEAQGVVPDMVVLGKPIGNGHPLAALITTREIADAFNTGMEFFSTFGGNTVSSLVGLTVLSVVMEEGLAAHALRTGERLLRGLRPFVDKYPLVGDVRGSGLFLGVELVRDRTTLEPADKEASFVANRMREEGVLLGTDGPFHNVIKIRPPMPFNEANADQLVATLEKVLGEVSDHM